MHSRASTRAAWAMVGTLAVVAGPASAARGTDAAAPARAAGVAPVTAVGRTGARGVAAAKGFGVPAAVRRIDVAGAAGDSVVDVLDLDEELQQEIERLERASSGDAPPARLALSLQWLAELYLRAGRANDADRCWARILDLFPGDLTTLNRRARLALDTGHAARADSLLGRANAWAREIDPTSAARAETWTLWARAALALGDPVRAERRARRARLALEGERAAPALRVLVEALAAQGRYDDAAREALGLVGLLGATQRDDVNALLALVPRTTILDAASVHEAIARAVEDTRRRRRERIEATGARVLDIATPDGVTLEATLRRTGPSVVVFVHDIGGERSAFGAVAQLCALDGISTLAVDLRAHGASRSDSLTAPGALDARQRARWTDDVSATIAAARGMGLRVAAVVAVGVSCAIVEKALAQEPGERPARAWISPAFARDDPALDNALAFAGPAPVLVLYAPEDLVAARSVDRAARILGRRLRRRAVPGGAHGLDVLRRTPGRLVELVDWLRERAR